MKKGLFVTGTDTGIGKTVVSAALLAALTMRIVAPGMAPPDESRTTPDSCVVDD